MRKAGSLVLLMLAALIAACGGGGDDGTIVRTGSGGGGGDPQNPQTPPITSLAIETSGDSLPGDGTSPVTLRVQALDAGRASIEGVEVAFSTDSGSITVTQPVTGADGIALATLNTTDPTNRMIMVTATATNNDGSQVSESVNIEVVGPAIASVSISASSPTLLSDGTNPVQITAFVRDANNNAIPGVQVAFTADSGSVIVEQAQTGDSSPARATLTTAGEPELRTITVTASVTDAQMNVIENTVAVQVVDVDEDVEDPPPVLSRVSLVSSSNILQSDGAQPVTLTARVLDENNVVLPDVEITFSTDSGELTVTQDVTGEDGLALALLSTQENPANRVITVTATATNRDGTPVTDTVEVEVVGTRFGPVNGPTALVQGNTGTYSAALLDANDSGIQGVPLTISSALGNTIEATTLITDSQGRVGFDLIATTGGTETITVAGLGIQATTNVLISTDSFRFVDPTPPAPDDPEPDPITIPLDTNRTIAVSWQRNGSNIPDGTRVVFSTTRGTLGSAEDTTTGGLAQNVISANDAGPAVITATGTGDNAPSSSIQVLFVAETPDNLEIQASPFNIGPNEQSTIRAVVRDAEGNRVFGQRVIFELSDTTGGSLTDGIGVTDEQGEAATVYQASDVTGGSQSVSVTARLDGTSIQDTVTLTVARRELFIAFGTGNTLEEPSPTRYSLPILVFATDADGNPVPDVAVNMSVLSFRYQKGYWIGDTVNNLWFTEVNATCDEEDLNQNGRLDPGEDTNGNGVLDVGNEAVISPGVAVTGLDGTAEVNITYAQEAGAWLQVLVEARTDVEGTEFSETATFLLPVLADDVSDIEQTPPGNSVPLDPLNGYPNGTTEGFITGPVSPFGYSQSCLNGI